MLKNKGIKESRQLDFSLPVKRAAFTLAEVLITLGIIGVVAAMTIPILISKYQKKAVEAKLKENYSIFAQVTRRMINDEISLSFEGADGSDEAIKKWFDSNLLPYMNVARVCYNSQSGCWPSSSKTRNLDGSDFGDCTKGTGCGNNTLSFIMNNGTMVTLDVGNNAQLRNIFGVDSTASTCMKIYMDVNGDEKPNKFGVDTFLMTITEDGFVPAGYSKTTEQLADSCKTGGNGYWCMTYVKNNNWEIPDKVWKDWK